MKSGLTMRGQTFTPPWTFVYDEQALTLEGDYGSCTVVVSKLLQKKLIYAAQWTERLRGSTYGSFVAVS